MDLDRLSLARRGVPTSFVTERLLIRAPQLDEVAELNRAIVESLDELRPWLPFARLAPSVDDTQTHVACTAADYAAGRDHTMRFVLSETGEIIGSGGLHSRSQDPETFEIGYWRRVGFGGKGYITEAVRGLTGFGFGILGAKRMEIHADARNERSLAVARRAGFSPLRELPNRVGVDGQPTTTVVYGLSRPDWQAQFRF